MCEYGPHKIVMDHYIKYYDELVKADKLINEDIVKAINMYLKNIQNFNKLIVETRQFIDNDCFKLEVRHTCIFLTNLSHYLEAYCKAVAVFYFSLYRGLIPYETVPDDMMYSAKKQTIRELLLNQIERIEKCSSALKTHIDDTKKIESYSKICKGMEILYKNAQVLINYHIKKIEKWLEESKKSNKTALVKKIEKTNSKTKKFKICPYCGEELNISNKAKCCPYCGEDFIIK